MLNYLISLDIVTLNYIRSSIDPSNYMLVKLIKIFSDFWVIFVAISLVFLWLTWVYKKDDTFKVTALNIFYTIIFCFILYMILNLWLPIRPRPETVSSIRPLVDHLPDNSFPSGHGIFAWAAVLAFFTFINKKIYWVLLLILSIIMLYCRVLSWVHYPWDVLVWFLLWLIFSGIYIRFLSQKSFVNDVLMAYPIKLLKVIKL